MNEDSKMNIFQQLRAAVTQMKAYKKLAGKSMITVIGYLCVLMVITTFISSVIPVIGYVVSIGGYENFFNNQVPKFELSNGVLEMEHRLSFDNGVTSVIIDSDVDVYKEADVSADFLQQILVSKSNIIIKNLGQTVQMPLSQMSNITLVNEDLANMSPIIYAFIVLITILTFFLSAVKYLLAALMFACLGLVLSSAQGMKLKFTQLFKISIYAKTTAILVASFNVVLGYLIPSFLWVSISVMITCFYIAAGINAHRNSDAPSNNLEQF